MPPLYVTRQADWSLSDDHSPRLDTSSENHNKGRIDRTTVTPENIGQKVLLREL